MYIYIYIYIVPATDPALSCALRTSKLAGWRTSRLARCLYYTVLYYTLLYYIDATQTR